jgi:hypothetical protein
MPFLTVREAADAELNGFTTMATARKAPTQITGAGVWFDLSMSPGNPSPQYYSGTPMVSTALRYRTNGGMYVGQPVAPATKYLRRFLGQTATAAATPLPIELLDYLLYYPSIDEGDTEPQDFINTVSLPRWESGEGVQIMAVVVGGQTGGQTFNITYTNSKGVSGRKTPNITMNAQATNGTLITSAPATGGTCGPFLPLAPGDTGVRSIEQTKMNGADVGIFTLVLVKPLAPASLRGIDAPVEIDYITSMPMSPIIADDAYINAICCPSGNLAASGLHFNLTTVWK